MLHASVEHSQILPVSSLSGPNAARSNLSWAKEEILMQADLYRVSFSFFRLGLFLHSNTNLSCNLSRGVLIVFVFASHPDSLMMRGACLKFGSMSKNSAV